MELTQQLKKNYREADISLAEMVMLEFAELLTVQPSNVVEADVDRLREHGWNDADVVDIVHVTALFNYMSRVADGLGVEMEDYVLEAEERDRAVIDTSTWGKRNRP